jgi:hypothetical protein
VRKVRAFLFRLAGLFHKECKNLEFAEETATHLWTETPPCQRCERRASTRSEP